jgi:thiamine biosynthesis lipoprotein
MTTILILLAAALGPAEPGLIARSHVAMGTTFDILVYEDQAPRAQRAMAAAFAEIERLDGILSHYKPESELRRMARGARTRPVRVSPELYDVLRESLRYARLSGGAFDPTVAPLVRAWKSGDPPGEPELERLRECTGWEKLRLEAPDRVRVLSACLELDLGGIGKGYAVDRAAEILESAGIRRALINAGSSSMRALDPPSDQPGWTVELPHDAGTLTLARASLSVSEQAHGHIVDPATGRPSRESCAVAVTTPTATMSDALSTALVVLGPRGCASVLAAFPEATVRWMNTGRGD